MIGGYTHAVRGAFSGRVVSYQSSKVIRRGRSQVDRRHTSARLRTQFFAVEGDHLRRYGVQFDDVMVHLWRQRRHVRRFRLRDLRYMEDLVLAVACTNHVTRAWHDLVDQFERPLIRHCRNWLEEPQAIIFVRRQLRELQAGHKKNRSADNGLALYLGTRSLRHWLADRLTSTLRGQRMTMADHAAGGPLRMIGSRFIVAGGSMGCHHLPRHPRSDTLSAEASTADGLR